MTSSIHNMPNWQYMCCTCISYAIKTYLGSYWNKNKTLGNKNCWYFFVHNNLPSLPGSKKKRKYKWWRTNGKIQAAVFSNECRIALWARPRAWCRVSERQCCDSSSWSAIMQVSINQKHSVQIFMWLVVMGKHFDDNTPMLDAYLSQVKCYILTSYLISIKDSYIIEIEHLERRFLLHLIMHMRILDQGCLERTPG